MRLDNGDQASVPTKGGHQASVPTKGSHQASVPTKGGQRLGGPSPHGGSWRRARAREAASGQLRGQKDSMGQTAANEFCLCACPCKCM